MAALDSLLLLLALQEKRINCASYIDHETLDDDEELIASSEVMH